MVSFLKLVKTDFAMKVVQERNIVNVADSSFDLVKQCQIKDIMVKCLTCVSYFDMFFTNIIWEIERIDIFIILFNEFKLLVTITNFTKEW